MKTSELIDKTLDEAVGRCEWNREEGDWRGTYRAAYSTDWNQGGPIIEREKIGVFMLDGVWSARCQYKGAIVVYAEGPTPLIAAMRCYVASKLGDEVDVPEALT